MEEQMSSIVTSKTTTLFFISILKALYSLFAVLIFIPVYLNLKYLLTGGGDPLIISAIINQMFFFILILGMLFGLFTKKRWLPYLAIILSIVGIIRVLFFSTKPVITEDWIIYLVLLVFLIYQILYFLNKDTREFFNKKGFI